MDLLLGPISAFLKKKVLILLFGHILGILKVKSFYHVRRVGRFFKSRPPHSCVRSEYTVVLYIKYFPQFFILFCSCKHHRHKYFEHTYITYSWRAFDFLKIAMKSHILRFLVRTLVNECVRDTKRIFVEKIQFYTKYSIRRFLWGRPPINLKWHFNKSLL